MQTANRTIISRVAVVLTSAALSLVVIATPAAAQRKAVIVTATTAEHNRAIAESLVVQASAFTAGEEHADRYISAAKLYRRAAVLRGDDSVSATNFRMAAWSYRAGGDNTVALGMLKRAGERAERVGDIEGAIGSYVDAAVLASTVGRSSQIAPLMRQVDALLASPLLASDRRVALLQRIDGEPALAGMVAMR